MVFISVYNPQQVSSISCWGFFMPNNLPKICPKNKWIIFTDFDCLAKLNDIYVYTQY